MSTAGKPSRTALVCAGQGIGNIVMATPTIAAVASMGYEVDVYLWLNYPDTLGLLEGWDVIRNVFTSTPTPNTRLRRDPGRRAGNRTPPYDVVVRTVWHRGESLGLGPEHRPDDCALRTTHEARANLSAARSLGYAGPLPAPHVEWEIPHVNLPRSYIVCAPGYSTAHNDLDWRRKRWPHWGRFCAAFRRARAGAAIVAVGSAACHEAWDGRGDLEFWGAMQLRQVAGLLRGANGVVAIDNGIAHVAAALNVPTFVLFGGTSEVKNRPLGRRVRILTAGVRCRPCQLTKRWDDCADWRCMSELEPAKVLSALEGEI